MVSFNEFVYLVPPRKSFSFSAHRLPCSCARKPVYFYVFIIYVYVYVLSYFSVHDEIMIITISGIALLFISKLICRPADFSK
jgi:hypothetical protein